MEQIAAACERGERAMKLSTVSVFVCATILAGCGLPRGMAYEHWANSAQRSVGDVEIQWMPLDDNTYQFLAINGGREAQRSAGWMIAEEICGAKPDLIFAGIIGVGGYHEMTFECTEQ